jgi:hypothetical protein
MLWTDANSREFIAKEYPWFLDTYDDYKYAIQRADAIRYFVLDHFGGIYLDLDVGCLRPLDPLLVHQVILPKTIPVGVSNDIMFAERGHPFMTQTIHNLVTFDHSWFLNYPTVMFSTGPMFLSAQYGIYTTAHPFTPEAPGGDVRVLPRALYGKNAKPSEAPHAFFAHYYGSSWHADDAAFVGFLGHWGRGLMLAGFALLVLGLIRLSVPSARARRPVAIVLPRWAGRRNRFQLSLRGVTLAVAPPTPTSASTSAPPSPVPSLDEEDVFTLQLPFDVRASRAASPAPSDRTDVFPSRQAVMEHPLVDVVSRVGRGITGLFGGSSSSGASSSTERPRHSRRGSSGLLFTMLPSDDYELEQSQRSPPPEYAEAALGPPAPAKGRTDDVERTGLHVHEPYAVPAGRGLRVETSTSAEPSRAPTPVEAPARGAASAWFTPHTAPAPRAPHSIISP